ncbi:MAG: superoxide dismutase [Ni] [Candidatus Zixiibacteriota bacterium]
MGNIFTKILLTFFLIAIPTLAYSHCEIPCGIYDDQLRYNLLKEHITTIEKSMNSINQLSKGHEDGNGEDHEDYNQIVRWVMNKEDHVDKFVEIVTQYFLTQRIKPVASDDPGFSKYQMHLQLYHEMMVYAMKCRQTTDTTNTDKLKELVDKSEKLYFEK